ncbi:hypothetical protein GCM10009838_11710 [Catenulispora subtropica]|uniref:Uncharacterized protein n=2 Tax=Catenulispora subtropica TaxID=450798 RepID=A0ABN2QS71_9ACTN
MHQEDQRPFALLDQVDPAGGRGDQAVGGVQGRCGLCHRFLRGVVGPVRARAPVADPPPDSQDAIMKDWSAGREFRCRFGKFQGLELAGPARSSAPRLSGGGGSQFGQFVVCDVG